MSDTDPLVKALLRERYGCNHWWKTPPSNNRTLPPDDLGDDEVIQARRRRELVDAYEAIHEETA